MGGQNNKLYGLLVIFLLIGGVFVTVIATRQQTQTQQKASEIANINTGQDISQTNNADGTMGPIDTSGNLSNGMSVDQLGSLIFLVSDAGQNKAILPTGISSTGSKTSAVKGAQEVKSLIIKVSKIEVHIASLASGKTVDHWETLNIPLSISVDLAQLSQGGVTSLGLTKLAAGKYTEVRLYIQSANAVISDGTTQQLSIANRAGVVRVVQPFTITKGQNTTLVMDFDTQRSVIYDGTNYLLKPVISKLQENN